MGGGSLTGRIPDKVENQPAGRKGSFGGGFSDESVKISRGGGIVVTGKGGVAGVVTCKSKKREEKCRGERKRPLLNKRGGEKNKGGLPWRPRSALGQGRTAGLRRKRGFRAYAEGGG